MKTKLTLIFFTAIAFSASAVVLTWDASPEVESIEAYCVYEKVGSNWVKQATVITNECTLPTLPGLHLFSCTASNRYGESPFSDSAQYWGATAPTTLRIDR